MLPKNNRLSQKKFDHVYNKGESVSGGIGYIKILQTDPPTRISCVVSGDEAKTSVKRTRIRRRGYAAVEEFIDDIPGQYSIVWFLPARAASVSIDKLRDSFVRMLQTADVYIDWNTVSITLIYKRYVGRHYGVFYNDFIPAHL